MRSARVALLFLLVAACRHDDGPALDNPDLRRWSNGDSTAPDGWQCGGPSACTIVHQDSVARFHSNDGPVALFQDVTRFENEAPFTFSAWVETGSADAANLVVSGGNWWVESPRHSGNGAWEQLTAHGTVPGNARSLRVHVWARNGARVAVRDVALTFEPVPWSAHLPGLVFGALLLIAAALLINPASRQRLVAYLSPPADPADARSRSPRPENLFVLLGTLFGLAFIAVTPPFQVPDEPAHFRRALQLSDGELKPTVRDDKGQRYWGAIQPLSLLATERAANLAASAFDPDTKISFPAVMGELSRPLEPEKREFFAFGSPAMYAPVPYLPQLIGVVVGRIIGGSPLVLLYLARLCNLAAWLVLVRLAIRVTPLAQWGFVALALTPMSLSQAASASPDTMTNALSMLTVATFLSLAFHEETPLPRRRLLGLLGLCVTLALAKQMYLFLSVLFLLIPVSKVGSRLKYLGTFAAIVAAQVAVNVAWWAYAMRGHAFAKEDARPAEQLAYMLQSPGAFVKVLLDTFAEKWGFYLHSFVGNLGWLTVPMPLWVVLTFFGTLAVLALFFAGDRVHLRPWQRALLFAPAPAIWLLILTYHYLIWNPPRYPVIEGGQGRYLIPLAPLVLAAVAGPRWRWRADPAAIRVPLGVVLATVLVVALVTSARRFYF